MDSKVNIKMSKMNKCSDLWNLGPFWIMNVVLLRKKKTSPPPPEYETGNFAKAINERFLSNFPIEASTLYLWQ